MRVLKLRSSINYVMDDTEQKKYRLLDEEVRALQKTIDLLKPICLATDKAQKDDANLVEGYRQICSLQSHLQVLSLDSAYDEARKVASDSIAKRQILGHVGGTAAQAAALLDPAECVNVKNVAEAQKVLLDYGVSYLLHRNIGDLASTEDKNVEDERKCTSLKKNVFSIKHCTR